MIRKLLIANRGEIARRVQRTARDMGMATVAVYADDDAGAPFAREADEAVALGGRRAAETYLDEAKLVAAARRTGADAVHPGYGFLSERASFARAVLGAGLTWVGPPPDVIAAMGDKLEAKRRMAAAGVPVLPTVEVAPDGSVDPGGVTYPALVKAAAGGGGRGMRVVERPDDLADAVAAARREAESAFGDGTVFVERWVADARHVEVQVLGDRHGHVVHCFERECSIQRRHQKVVEEAPSPALDEALRARLGEAAVVAATAIGYEGAGTVEFLLGPDGGFAFLEVNTRLQVEHPVTELVTGLDLVREQLLVAEGHPLSVAQDDLALSGHAIEARLYAEDPEQGFLPATGTVVRWEPPAEPAVRVDAGIETGSVVGLEFDPLLAKVVAHAPTRTEAARRLALALERTRVHGVVTNRDLLVAVLRHPAFLAGEATTAFLGRDDVVRRRVPSADEVRVAAVAATLATASRARSGADVLRSLPAGWRNSVLPAERSVWEVEGTEVVVEHGWRRDGTIAVTVDGEASVASSTAVDGDRVELVLDGRRVGLAMAADGRDWWVQGPAGEVRLRARPRFPERSAEAAAGELVAPMPGHVLSVHVASGDVVEEGQLLVVLEAMKMEHRVTAPAAGVVADVHVVAGGQVAGGDVLLVVEAAG